MKRQKAWLNKKFVDIDRTKVSIFDRGFLYGDGAFETMRSYAGIVFKLDDHLARLFDALKILKIKLPYSRKYLAGAIYRLLDINGLKSAYIRLAVTRGEGRFGIGYKDVFAPNAVIVAKEFEGYPEWMFRRGISAGVAGIRQNEYSPLAAVKSMNYLNYIMARFEAKEKGYDEAILLNTRGFVTEGATSNIFLVKKDVLITPSPDSGILQGITRGVILAIAKRLRFRVKEKRISMRELALADEIFLTNSLAEVLPVTRIGPKPVGCGHPGEATKFFRISYQKEVIRDTVYCKP